MIGHKLSHSLLLPAALVLSVIPSMARAQTANATWTFAVSGDSRDCGDFVMPAIAADVKAEKDAFYWHLGDFRKMQSEDQDLAAMDGGPVPIDDYLKRAWSDFLAHQIGAFGDLPVFIARGNHETLPNMTREDYIKKFYALLDRPEIAAQRKIDESHDVDHTSVAPWYHWIHNGVDFINMDNASMDEFSDEQVHWLRSVLDYDLSPKSGIKTIVMGAHEALPHSTGILHAMDDWNRGEQTGDIVYQWFYDAESAGKHVYLLASHSHYYSPNIYRTLYWYQYSKRFVPGIIIGTAGAYRYPLAQGVDPSSETMIYGYLQATVKPDGTIDFKLHKLSEQDLLKAKWPNAPDNAIHECYVKNGDPSLINQKGTIGSF